MFAIKNLTLQIHLLTVVRLDMQLCGKDEQVMARHSKDLPLERVALLDTLIVRIGLFALMWSCWPGCCT